MEGNLLVALKKADRVLVEAYAHQDKSKALKREADNTKTSTATKWMIGLSPFVLGYAASFLELIPLPGGLLRGLMSAISMILAMGAIAIIPILICVNDRKIRSKKSELLKASDSEHMQALEILHNYSADIAFLPVEYRYPEAVEHAIHSVQSGRAATLGEVLDRYDEYIHRKKVEDANNQMVKQQQRITAQLADIQATDDAIFFAQLFR